MEFTSKLIDDAVNAFSDLPGIGKKTALRLVLHLLQEEQSDVASFSNAILKMRSEIKFCTECHNISDADKCSICLNPARDRSVICVVSNLRDVMAIENTGQYKGTYHVLGGVISPIEGIGPDQLTIKDLLTRVKTPEVKEVIMAISPTIDGETTIFYISGQCKELDVTISTLARGISFGGELEYADELTLARSIASRRPYGEAPRN